jgi:hypothetical protein
MLAAQAEKPAEDGEAAKTSERFGCSLDQAVEWITLDGSREPHDEAHGEGNSTGEAPRIGAAEAEVVEHVARFARDLWPKPRRDGRG